MWNWGLDISTLTQAQQQYSQYGLVNSLLAGPITMPNGVKVTWGRPLGYADTPIMFFSKNNGATWQGVPANQVSPPPASDPSLGPLVSNIKKGYHYNFFIVQFVDPHLSRVYIRGSDGVDLLPLFVGDYANSGFTWTQQTTVWNDAGAAFDPKYPNVVYSALVIPTSPKTPELKTAISVDGGNTWTSIPIPPQLSLDYFAINGIERATNGTTLLVFAMPHGQTPPSNSSNYPTTATIFIPDATIQNPSLMTTTPVDLSLKIGSPELVITKNGTKTVVALDAKPIVLDGRTMLPIRPIVEALGGGYRLFRRSRLDHAGEQRGSPAYRRQHGGSERARRSN